MQAAATEQANSYLLSFDLLSSNTEMENVACKFHE